MLSMIVLHIIQSRRLCTLLREISAGLYQPVNAASGFYLVSWAVEVLPFLQLPTPVPHSGS